jgi:regulator of sirC expression with transglutaminase-like and TPR domain
MTSDAALTGDQRPGVDVLLRLLDDPDEAVGVQVIRQLADHGPGITGILRGVIDRADDTISRGRATQVIHMHQREALMHLVRSIVHHRTNGTDIDLEEAMVMLDAFGDPGRNMTVIRRQLDGMALDVHERFITMQPATDLTQLLAINCVLFEERGFTGAGEPYYVPSNSYLSTVMTQRKGIPISLCALMLLLADRSGLELLPVALPFHFVLYSPVLECFVDGYHGGNLLDRKDCRAIVERNGMAFRDDMLAPVTSIDCVIRMMRNLAFAHAHVGDVWEATMLHRTLESLQ